MSRPAMSLQVIGSLALAPSCPLYTVRHHLIGHVAARTTGVQGFP